MPNIITAMTESAWFTSIMQSLSAFGVPIATWTGKRHPGLALAKYVARALGAADTFFTELEASIFLQTAFGVGLLKLARSQYQLEPFSAVAQLARFTVTSLAGSPAASAAAGDITAGQVGGALEWVNEDAFSVPSGGKAIVLFRAREQGSSYNVPSGTALELRTTILGCSVACPAVGAATPLGSGTSGLLLYAARAGVTIEVVNGGPNQSLAVAENLLTGLISVSPATDGGGVITSTADQVRAALAQVPELLAWAKNATTGGGLIAATTSPVPLDWSGDYIQVAGDEAESADSVKARSLTRFMGLGGWAGDGAPPAPVSTDEALEFWARNPPAGATRSVVTGVTVLSNFLSGAPSGKDITVLVWKKTGALSAAERTAVDGNFYNGRKFSIGSDLHTITVTNVALALTGSVTYAGGSGYTPDEVRAAIVARLTAYQQNTKVVFPGCTMSPELIAARIETALPDEVNIDADLTGPAAPVTYAYNEWPVIDSSALTITAI